MSKVKVAAFSLSLNGYGAGPDQTFIRGDRSAEVGIHGKGNVSGRLATHVVLRKN